MHALNLTVDRGDKSDIDRVKEEVQKVYGDVKTENVMFFAYVRSDQVTDASRILQVSEWVSDQYKDSSRNET